jgi:hypothetical protein
MMYLITEPTVARKHHDLNQPGPETGLLLSVRLGASVEHVN